ncbi:F-box protein CPR1 [Bienertia sinuspersici]
MSLCLSACDPKMETILKKRILRERKRSFGTLVEKFEDSFSEDLVIEILSWLSVKNLLQFKVVCKSWYDIIENPHFISKHLNNYCSRNNEFDGCFIIQNTITQAGEIDNYQLLLNDDASRVIADQIVDTPVSNTYMCGPCDGIYYLWCFYEEHERFLWNPALNELKRLPPLIMKPNHFPSHITLHMGDYYGFGYDSFTKDYKVIIIKGYCDSHEEGNDLTTPYPLSIFIYSLRSGCWSYMGDLSKYYYLEHNKCYVFINDSVYWLGSNEYFQYCDVIISFNLTTNNIEELQPPNYDEKVEPPDNERLVVCYESVGLLVGYHKKKYYKMWVLNKGIWNNICMIDLSFGAHYYRPIGHWKDNKLIFQVSGWELCLYDLDTQEVAYLRGYFRVLCENICAYKESLVSVLD